MENKEINENEELIQKPVLPGKKIEIKSIFLIVVGLVFLLLVVEGVLLYGFKKEDLSPVKAIATVIPYPMAMVEYRPVYFKSFWDELGLILRTCEQAKVGTECQIVDKDRVDVYNNLLNEQVVIKLAEKYNIVLPDQKLNDEMKTISEQNGGDEEFKKLLEEKFGWNLEDFKKRVYVSLLAKEVEDNLVEKVDAKHILIGIDQGASQEDIDKAKQKAQEALAKINSGVDFDEVAKEYSDDETTKESGGDLGYFSRGVMVKEFEDAAFSLAVGQVSELVKTDFGWHIIKVVDKKGEVKQNFMSWLEEEKGKMRIWEFYKIS